MTPMNYQVVIMGAGVAGMTAALVLAKNGVKVAVVDKNSRQKQSFGECVHGTIQPILSELNLFEQFCRDGHFELQGYEVDWDREGRYERNLIASPYGTGWILNRERFDNSLFRAALAAGVDFFWNTRLIDIGRDNNKWQLQLKSTERVFPNTNQKQYLTASYIVDATGRARVLTRKLNIAEKKADALMACCTYLHHDGSGLMGKQTAVIKSSPNGWWYLAPFSQTMATLCFFTDNDLAMPKSHSALLHQANELTYLNPYLAQCDLEKTTEFKAISSYSSCVASCVGEGWIAIGDAACSYDPLSSYGITSAMGSAYYGATAIVQAMTQEQDSLAQYQQLMHEQFLTYVIDKNKEYQRVTHYDTDFWKRRQY
ncbi:hypothetical protein N476_18015 [Pseudoalteromonas luteoviolacea H33]|uniref:FAD-binding domain-containing protein n=2 Tax=Pseudoalteromonas luteoviolacea TaxID=43657 RepID=A0A167E208_9GAMM|nr:hypothetical protein N476_18015 [Pseudoalteromonas luteoviolacea H33]KZN74816.1 hypothetical protein N477_21430 [Pseudoalteromonas luteoviolacea H33-S]